MINGKSVLALIPARGGSKGLSGKNILPLAGKPLISWSIETAHGSKYIDKCIVSTDDKDIADVAKSYKCEIPFMRPKELSLDEAPSFPVMAHAVEFFKKNNLHFDYFILLEPTSPLRDTKDIDCALEKLNSNKDIADSIVGVSKVESTHPVFDVRINNAGLIEPYVGKKFKSFRRQDIEPLYFKEGSIYVSDTKVLLNKKNFYHDRTLPYIVPRWKSLEIDEMVDLIIAESLMSNRSRLNNSDA